MMSELKRCKSCGTRQSGVDDSNQEYETLVRLILETGDERQLLSLIDIMRGKITTCVRTSLGEYKLAYEDKDLWHVEIIANASTILKNKLSERQ